MTKYEPGKILKDTYYSAESSEKLQFELMH